MAFQLGRGGEGQILWTPLATYMCQHNLKGAFTQDAKQPKFDVINNLGKVAFQCKRTLGIAH